MSDDVQASSDAEMMDSSVARQLEVLGILNIPDGYAVEDLPSEDTIVGSHAPFEEGMADEVNFDEDDVFNEGGEGSDWEPERSELVEDEYEDMNEEAGASTSPNKPRRRAVCMREIENLSFANPGGEMARFLPNTLDLLGDNNRRARRENNVKKGRPSSSSNPDTTSNELYTHDKRGKLRVPQSIVHSGIYNLCDCLLAECSGCQWPCSTCGGRMCGPICRVNRKMYLASVEYRHAVDNDWKSPKRVTKNPLATNKKL